MILIDRWLEAAVTAVEESATTLGFEPPQLGARAGWASPDLFGAFVSVTSDKTSIQVGVLATADGHAALARTMLALEADEQLGEGDIMDAVRELTNVIAGGLKRRMIGSDPGLRIGLPVFRHDSVERSSSLESALQHLLLSGERVALVVLQNTSRHAA